MLLTGESFPLFSKQNQLILNLLGEGFFQSAKSKISGLFFRKTSEYAEIVPKLFLPIENKINIFLQLRNTCNTVITVIIL